LAKRLQKNKAGVQMEASAPKVKMSFAEQQAWEAAGLHCSANERRADEASRDVEAWLKCKYMREHLGEEYSGVVSSVATFGIFVTLDAMYVEGLVHITELGGEYYRFDEVRQELRGERTGIRYAIGTRVQIQVSRVDLDGRKIDFRLVNGLEDMALRSLRDKGAASKGGASKERSVMGRSEASAPLRDIPAVQPKRRKDHVRDRTSGPTTAKKAPAPKALYKKKVGKVRPSKR
jgi:ribonuclease R